jgi:peptide/nickel transport system substrate-binding protein
MHGSSRRGFLRASGAVAAAPVLAPLFGSGAARAQAGSVLTIAYNTTLPGWDPTSSAHTANPVVQSIFKSVFDQYVDQNPDLSFKPGILTRWEWNRDKTRVHLTLRKGAWWHDGTPVTPEDLVWSLERASDPQGTNPMQFVWGKMSNFRVDGYIVTADVKEFEPALLKWMAFLTAYILPKKAYTASGAQGWDAKPIGSGPYMVDKFERNGYVRLKAFPKYWGAKPAFETVVFKFVPDPASRVAEIESGSSDLTLEIPYEEYDRLIAKPGLAGAVHPTSDLGIIFLTNRDVMLDANVRLAAAHAIDKKAIVDRLMRGYGTPVDTLQAPQYAAFDPSIKVKYDPELAKQLLARSGYSIANPAKFSIQTTRGYKPKDYEMVSAVTGMWRKVGIDANIEVYDIAKHFELITQHALAPAAFYSWGNSIGDPSTSTGFAMFGPSPHAAWKTEDVDRMIAPLWSEKDEAKRIAGYKAVDRHIAEHGYAIPLLQYAQPVVYKKTLRFTPHVGGYVLPQVMTPA